MTATINGHPTLIIPSLPFLVWSEAWGPESAPFADQEAAVSCLEAIRAARFPVESWPNKERDEREYPWLFQAVPSRDNPEEWVYRCVA